MHRCFSHSARCIIYHSGNLLQPSSIMLPKIWYTGRKINAFFRRTIFVSGAEYVSNFRCLNDSLQVIFYCRRDSKLANPRFLSSAYRRPSCWSPCEKIVTGTWDRKSSDELRSVHCLSKASLLRTAEIKHRCSCPFSAC